HLPRAEVVEDRRLHVLIDAPVVSGRLGDAYLAAVESSDRLVGRHRTSRRISAARSHSACVGTRAKRTYPSPAGPKNEPGAATMPCSSSRRANGSDGPPTSTQR